MCIFSQSLPYVAWLRGKAPPNSTIFFRPCHWNKRWTSTLGQNQQKSRNFSEVDCIPSHCEIQDHSRMAKSVLTLLKICELDKMRWLLMPSASFMLFATRRWNLWNSLTKKKWLLLLGTKLKVGRVLNNCQASLESWRNPKWSWKLTPISMGYGLTVCLLAIFTYFF